MPGERAEVFQCTGSETPNEQMANAMRAALLILVTKSGGTADIDTHYAIGVTGMIAYNTQTGVLTIRTERK